MSTLKSTPLSVNDLHSSPENDSVLTDILGLSPTVSETNNSVKTYQCGEFKYPDVTSPLNRILSDRRGSLNDEKLRSICRRSSLLEVGSRLLVEPSSFDDVFLIRQGPVVGGRRPSNSSTPSILGRRDSLSHTGSSPDSDSAFSSDVARGSSSSTKSPVARETTPPTTYSTSSTSENIGMSGGGIGASNVNQVAGNGAGMPPGTVDMDVLSELLRSLSMQHEVNNSNSGTLSSVDGGGPVDKDSGISSSAVYSSLPDHPYDAQQPINQYYPMPDPNNNRVYEQYPVAPSTGVISSEERKIWQDIQTFVQNNPHLGHNNKFNTPSPSLSPDEAIMDMSGGIYRSGIGQGGGGSYNESPGGNADAVSLERAARFHRSSAALNDAACTWSGQLPMRNHRSTTLSCKVFLGGVPWDITEAGLIAAFKPFGNVKVEWPGKESASIPKGYLYIVFEHEKQVKSLLSSCTHDYGSGGSWYFKVSSRRMRNKEVQVIPWVLADSGYVRCQSQRLDPQKTVFVGALHGMLNAEGLCLIFNDLFDGVVYAGIDTDKYKYPIGSARVTFNNYRSYMKAVSAAFIEIKTPKFTKKVQVDPYLEDALCTSCQIRQGPYFCRDLACFRYFCRSCWETAHEVLCHHKPLMRNCKHNSQQNRSLAPSYQQQLVYQ